MRIYVSLPTNFCFMRWWQRINCSTSLNSYINKITGMYYVMMMIPSHPVHSLFYQVFWLDWKSGFGTNCTSTYTHAHTWQNWIIETEVAVLVSGRAMMIRRRGRVSACKRDVIIDCVSAVMMPVQLWNNYAPVHTNTRRMSSSAVNGVEREIHFV